MHRGRGVCTNGVSEVAGWQHWRRLVIYYRIIWTVLDVCFPRESRLHVAASQPNRGEGPQEREFDGLLWGGWERGGRENVSWRMCVICVSERDLEVWHVAGADRISDDQDVGQGDGNVGGAWPAAAAALLCSAASTPAPARRVRGHTAVAPRNAIPVNKGEL